jgi:hypothetical protein
MDRARTGFGDMSKKRLKIDMFWKRVEAIDISRNRVEMGERGVMP